MAAGGFAQIQQEENEKAEHEKEKTRTCQTTKRKP